MRCQQHPTEAKLRNPALHVDGSIYRRGKRCGGCDNQEPGLTSKVTLLFKVFMKGKLYTCVAFEALLIEAECKKKLLFSKFLCNFNLHTLKKRKLFIFFIESKSS